MSIKRIVVGDQIAHHTPTGMNHFGKGSKAKAAALHERGKKAAITRKLRELIGDRDGG